MSDELSDPEPSRSVDVTADQLLARAIDVVRASRPMPLSNSVMISREELLDLLGAAADRLPEELRAARWLLKERDEFLEQARAEGDAIVREASGRAEQLVQRTEVSRAAEERARRLVADAEAEARRLRREAEDYCDQRLASFEIALEKTATTVREARERLQVGAQPEPPPPAVDDAEDDAFFDQDQ